MQDSLEQAQCSGGSSISLTILLMVALKAWLQLVKNNLRGFWEVYNNSVLLMLYVWVYLII